VWDLAVNFWQSDSKISHCTRNALLQYVVKCLFSKTAMFQKWEQKPTAIQDIWISCWNVFTRWCWHHFVNRWRHLQWPHSKKQEYWLYASAATKTKCLNSDSTGVISPWVMCVTCQGVNVNKDYYHNMMLPSYVRFQARQWQAHR